MTTQQRPMPGFVGYLWILVICASVIGPAII